MYNKRYKENIIIRNISREAGYRADKGLKNIYGLTAEMTGD